MIIRKPKAVILDWDGTLAITRHAVYPAIEHVLALYNKEPWEIVREKYRDTRKSFKENFPNFFGDEANEAYQTYLNYYQAHCYDLVKPVENAHDFLELCQQKNIDLYIISNKEPMLLLNEAKNCYADITFKKILGNGDAPYNKPAPDPVFVALDDVGYEINRDNVWMVGDTKQDTECAYGADILPVLLGDGLFMDNDYIKEKLESDKPLIIYQDFAELTSFMEKL